MPTARRATASPIAPVDWGAACERAGLPRPPVGYYPLGGGWGTSDLSPYANHGTAKNGASPTGSPWGGAFTFNGSTNRVEVPHAVVPPALPSTLAAWIYLDAAGNWDRAMHLGQTSDTYYGTWFQVGDTEELRIAYGDGTGLGQEDRRSKVGPSGSVPVSEWTHIAATVRGPTDMTLYVNGEDIGGTYEGNGGDYAEGSNIGYLGYDMRSDQYLTGDLSECVIVHGVSLSQGQIRYLANHPRGLLQPTSRIEQWAAIGGAGGVTLSPESLRHGHRLENAGSAQTHVMIPAELHHDHALENAAAGQVHDMSPEALAHDHRLQETTAVQTHVLSPEDLLHAHRVEDALLGEVIVLSPQDIRHVHRLAQAEAEQTHRAAPEDLRHAHELETTELSGVVHVVQPEDAAHAHRLQEAAITQTHAVLAEDLRHLHRLENAQLGDLAVGYLVTDRIVVAPVLLLDDPELAPELQADRADVQPELQTDEPTIEPED